MSRWLRDILRFKRSEEGIAFVEFAISIPFLLALLMGAIELTRYILIQQKVEKVAVTIADVVAQATTITNADLANIIDAASQVMQPYSFGASGYVIITSVTQTGAPGPGNLPKVNWQYTGGGTMNPAPGSHIGAPNNNASLPAGFTMADKDNIIVTEVFYNYTPLIAGNGVMNGALIYKLGIYKPRLGALGVLGWLCPNPMSHIGGCTGSYEEVALNVILRNRWRDSQDLYRGAMLCNG